MNAMQKSSQPFLKLEQINKRFGVVQALDHVDLSVNKGTVHAIVGENGAGKSTLMKILAGVHQPDGGLIYYEGKPQQFATPRESHQAGIAMIFQELDLVGDLNVAENIFLGREPKRWGCVVDFPEMISQTNALLKKIRLRIDPTSFVRDLPPADCQMIEIAKNLARQARLIIMDEPTSSLSAREAKRLHTLISQLKQAGITILYSSHRLEEVMEIADVITVLRDGQHITTRMKADSTIPLIIEHMVGRTLTEFYPARLAQLGDPVLVVKNMYTNQGGHNISFTLHEGEVVGMAGLVGSGRTGGVQALFGIDSLHSGSISLHGNRVDPLTPNKAIQLGMAYLTEDRKRTGLCLNLSSTWNITLPSLSRLGMRWIIHHKDEQELARQLGSRMVIKWADPSQPVENLSGGNQQKVLIARWVLSNADVVIFDEPTRGIDVGAKREVYRLMNQLAESGKAILFISSELEELMGMTDRILVMYRGKLMGNLTTRSTTPEDIMSRATLEIKT